MKNWFFIAFIGFARVLLAQETTIELNVSMFDHTETIFLADTGEWVYKSGDDISWADPELNISDWKKIKPNDIEKFNGDNNQLEGWFRIRIKLDSSFQGINLGHIQRSWAATDVFIDGQLVYSYGNIGTQNSEFKYYKRRLKDPKPLNLSIDKEHLIAIHFKDEVVPVFNELKSSIDETWSGLFIITGPEYKYSYLELYIDSQSRWKTIQGFCFILLSIFWTLYILNRNANHLLLIAIVMTMVFVSTFSFLNHNIGDISFGLNMFYEYLGLYAFFGIVLGYPLTLGTVFRGKAYRWHWVFSVLAFIYLNANFLVLNSFSKFFVFPIITIVSLLSGIWYLFSSWRKLRGAKWAIAMGIIIALFAGIIVGILGTFADLGYISGVNFGLIANYVFYIVFFSVPLSLVVYAGLWFKEMMDDVKQKSEKLIQANNEKREILEKQQVKLETLVEERTKELKLSLENLKSTQSQLIHSEKMASLGELTAGIAHEIQNPLNFVNNFSDLNKELIGELQEAIAQNDTEEVNTILADLSGNETKITHHGKRAEQIVKSMLQHSRTGSGEKELTDINAICDEYLRLSYHGYRAKDKSFQSDFKLDLDPDLPKINVVPQDIGRVLLNLINNAFQAVQGVEKPLVTIYTKNLPLTPSKGGIPLHGGAGGGFSGILITVSDNGPGIPDNIKDKIFQPFFTTKPTGEGTGLGLSMSYDIVTKGHGGELELMINEKEGTEFVIILPI